MNGLKIAFYILFTFLCFKGYTQTKELQTSFFIRGEKVENVKYYLIKGNRAYLQDYRNQKIIFRGDLPNEFSLLAIYKKHKVIIPIFRPDKVEYIEVYFDNRLFNNTIRKKYGGSFFKYLFKKDYLIDLGLEDVYRTFKLKHKYELIN